MLMVWRDSFIKCSQVYRHAKVQARGQMGRWAGVKAIDKRCGSASADLKPKLKLKLITYIRSLCSLPLLQMTPVQVRTIR